MKRPTSILKTRAACAAAVACMGIVAVACRGTVGDSDGDTQPPGTPAACKTSPLEDRLPPTMMRRLSRVEYMNTVAALFPGAVLDTKILPDDRKAETGGFYGTGVTMLTEQQLRNYQSAAEELADEVFKDAAAIMAFAGCAAQDASCADALMNGVGTRLFRRPFTDAEKANYKAKLYEPSKASFVTAMRALLSGLLQSVNFLYRVEVGTAAESLGRGVRRLNDYELASRLSYLLWASPPDAELLAAAAQGGLAGKLEEQARRLLADPRAQGVIQSFHEQLFDMERLESVTKDEAKFKADVWSESVKASMLSEFRAFVNHVVWSGNGNLDSLLTARYGFADANLAKLYGVAAPAGGGMQMVSFDQGQPRAGILTQAGYLASHAGPTESSVTKRGLTVRVSLLCQDVPAPDPEAMALMVPVQDRLVDNRCAGCHKLLDLIGRGLDNFDAVGAFRATTGVEAATTAGEIQAVGDATVTFNGPLDLGQKVAGTEEYKSCMVEQWFRFNAARAVTEADECVTRSLKDVLAAANGDVRELIVAFVKLDTFPLARVEAADSCQ